MILSGKKIFVLGERDGIPAPAITECVKAINDTEIIYMDTQRFGTIVR